MRILKDWQLAFVLLWESLKELKYLPRQLGRCFEHGCNMGYKTLPIVATMWHPERNEEYDENDIEMIRELFGGEYL